jgi:hypothetical protein
VVGKAFREKSQCKWNRQPPLVEIDQIRSDGQPGSFACPQVCNRTNEISLTPQKSASGKLEIALALATDCGRVTVDW